MKLPILYARAETGAVLTWEIKAEGDRFWTSSGQQGGVITVSKPTIVKGKNIGKANETSPEKQAEKEAKAKWDKKLTAGYFEKIEDIDNFYFFQPQLAQKYEDFKDEIDWSNVRLLQTKNLWSLIRYLLFYNQHLIL